MSKDSKMPKNYEEHNRNGKVRAENRNNRAKDGIGRRMGKDAKMSNDDEESCKAGDTWVEGMECNVKVQCPPSGMC